MDAISPSLGFALLVASVTLTAVAETPYFVNRYNAVPNTGGPAQHKQLGVWGHFTDADGRTNGFVPETGDEVGAFWSDGTTDILVGVATITTPMADENAYATLDLFGRDPEHPDGPSYGLVHGGTVVLRIYRRALDVVHDAYPVLVFQSEMMHQQDLAVPIERYTLTYTAGPGGTIDGVSPQTVDQGDGGTPVTAVSDPAAGSVFTAWSDGVRTAFRHDTSVADDISVVAHFSSVGGVPLAWYAQYGIAPEEDETWADVDSRTNPHKGMTLKQEYIADTNPTQDDSVLPPTTLHLEPDGGIRIEIGSTSPNRVYHVHARERLDKGEWGFLWSGAGTGGAWSFAPEGPHPRCRVFQTTVSLPPSP